MSGKLHDGLTDYNVRSGLVDCSVSTFHLPSPDRQDNKTRWLTPWHAPDYTFLWSRLHLDKEAAYCRSGLYIWSWSCLLGTYIISFDPSPPSDIVRLSAFKHHTAII